MPNVPGVSVIVTTKNNASTLEALLLSVRSQAGVNIELIVVDNGSTDQTKVIAERYADQVLDWGPERSEQRNKGVAVASGDYVLILDSDMILERDTVAECLRTAEALGAAAVVVPESTVGSSMLAQVRALERRCYEGDATIEAARFFRREAYLRFGGYDEALRGPEDWDLPERMRRSGEVVGRAERARVLHDESGVDLISHLGKKYYYGRSLGQYARRHPQLASRQFVLLRPAFIRNWRVLARRPLLAFGVFALKIAEFAAGAAGAASSALSRHSSRR